MKITQVQNVIIDTTKTNIELNRKILKDITGLTGMGDQFTMNSEGYIYDIDYCKEMAQKEINELLEMKNLMIDEFKNWKSEFIAEGKNLKEITIQDLVLNDEALRFQVLVDTYC